LDELGFNQNDAFSILFFSARKSYAATANVVFSKMKE